MSCRRWTKNPRTAMWIKWGLLRREPISCESHFFPPRCLVRRKRARYTSPYADLIGADVCGHRQVVRHQLPKLTSAGSSPVARSSESLEPGALPASGSFRERAGARTGEVARLCKTRERFASERAREPKAPGAAYSRRRIRESRMSAPARASSPARFQRRARFV